MLRIPNDAPHGQSASPASAGRAVSRSERRNELDIYEALYTTRAMRRVKPDPIPLAVQQKLLDAAIRAPSGGNAQMWRFLLVDDPALKARLGPIYRACLSQLWETIYKPRADAAAQAPDAPESREFLKMQRSASWLADHFESYPLFLFAFSQLDATGSSIFPAVWSAMLAARAEGIGSALTSVLMFRMSEVLEVLGVPKDQGWSFNACVSFGIPTGRWGVAPRAPLHQVSFRNRWGSPVGFEIPAPLWPAKR
jgi:nitroreductase